jgi:3-oxoacyl-[acyl-carrier protein] reductase
MTNRLTAVITGGGSGLGVATAERLRKDGTRVITLDLHGADHTVDITDVAALQNAAEEIGDIDILVNSAGIVGKVGPLLDTVPEDWRRVFEVNVIGTANTMRVFLPGMVRREWGRVVNVASMAGKEGDANLSIYSSSKAAVVGLTKSMGKEMARTGVLVNAIAPTVFATPLNDQGAPEVLEHLKSLIPLGRIGTAEEVAEVVAFLASDRMTFSTGAIFDINEDNLRDWLRDPPAMKAMQPGRGLGMPNLGLEEDEIDALVEYLMTLE